MLDGEAVVLGVDGSFDFNALHSGKHDEEVQLYAFDVQPMIRVMIRTWNNHHMVAPVTA